MSNQNTLFISNDHTEITGSMKCNLTAYCSVSLIIIFFVLFQSCVPSKNDSDEFENWTSTDPLSVNYKARKQKFDNQNLVYNPSFEFGKVKRIDSLTSSIKVDGWELVGSSVSWVNSEGDSVLKDSGQVYSGLHSVRVRRRSADETESIGQGILSDYIKVIPGNYLLTLYLNLKDIKNPKSRLGTKIYDAVDIRILYYDKNKIQISRKEYSEFYKKRIDNSFKGLSFANFSEIDSTGWLHIIGRSHIFPYQDGDLQDDTKFVRIFVGLKGTGILWVDDVDFRYTKWNFTTFERISPYFDTSLSKSDLIVPRPVKVDILESVIYYRPYFKESFPAILIPSSADMITLNAAKEFEEGIKEFLISIAGIDKADIPDLIRIGNLLENDNASIVFSLGDNNLFIKYRHKLPLSKIKDKKQGYFIYSIHDPENVVFLYGNSPEANYFAIQAALQLFDNKKALYHNANVIDYPFFEERSLFLTKIDNNTLDYLNKDNHSRFNCVYLPAKDDITRKIISDGHGNFSGWIYHELNPESEDFRGDIEYLDNLIRHHKKNIGGLAFLFHSPVADGVSLETAMNYAETICMNKPDSKTLKSLCEFVRSSGMPAEFLPCYSNNLFMYSCGAIPGCYEEMPDNICGNNISCIWSGYDLQSWRIDEADIYMFQKFCNDPVSFLDFTLYMKDRDMGYFGYDPLFPHKLLTASLFESYENEIVPEVYEKMEKIILGYDVSGVFDRIRLQTASDFLWNPVSYNADLSLYKALVSEFGIEMSRNILKFNDLYFKIKSELILAELPSSNTKQHLRKAIHLMDQIKIIQDQFIGLEQKKSFDELNNILESLMSELELKRNTIEETLIMN